MHSLVSHINVLILAYQFLSGSKSAKGDAVVLIGSSDAGKTCLFYRLGLDSMPTTVTSMVVNEEVIQVDVCSVCDKRLDWCV